MTQQQLGEAVNVELRTIQRLERGLTNVAVGTLIEIAHVLEVAPAVLFQETEVPEVKMGRPKKGG
ncbi:MAG: helix-turn-helix transcriptional regulator [Myxococcales bacterium]|nr:helix-turn-helix transcriptional regulator [Myxococcales bacterium]